MNQPSVVSPGRARLLRSLDLLDALQGRVLESVADVPPDVLSTRPNARTWCVAEVLDHLTRVETSLVRVMRSNLGQDHRTSLLGKVGYSAALIVMYSPIRIQLPKSLNFVAPGDFANDLETLRMQWLEARQQLKAFLAPLSDLQWEKGLFRHPAAGWMSAHDCITFSRAHLYHHTWQLARIRKHEQKRAG